MAEDYRNFDYDSYVKYLEMFKSMDNMRSFLIANKVSELGLPQFVKGIKTAGVGIHPVTNQVIFMFDLEFFHKISTPSLAFVFTHEMLHIAFGHPSRFNKMMGKVNGQKSTTMKQSVEEQVKARLWNIAADCIVNIWCDYLGFPATEEVETMLGSTDPETGEFKKGLIFPDRIGYPNFNSSTSTDDIYYWLLKQNEEDLKKLMDAMDDHSNWVEMNGPASDEFSEQVAGAMKPEFFKGAGKSMDSKEMKEMAGKNKEAKSNSFIDNYKPQTHGSGTNSELRHYQNLRNRVQNDVLQKIHRKIKSFKDTGIKETWTRPPKKLITMWPAILLPSDWNVEHNEKFSAVLAIDSSGSITDEMIAQFVRWARSFPMDKIDYEPMAFDDKPYTLSKPDFYNGNKYPAIPGRGGTDISLPEYYVQRVYKKKFKKRPDLVIVLTDGQGSTPFPIEEKYQDSYLWVMTANCGSGKDIVRKYCPKGIIFDTNIG